MGKYTTATAPTLSDYIEARRMMLPRTHAKSRVSFMSRSELAELVGLSKGNIQAIEGGAFDAKRGSKNQVSPLKAMTLEKLPDLAVALRVNDDPEEAKRFYQHACQYCEAMDELCHDGHLPYKKKDLYLPDVQRDLHGEMKTRGIEIPVRDITAYEPWLESRRARTAPPSDHVPQPIMRATNFEEAKNLPEFLQRRRNALGISFREMATYLEVPISQVRAMEGARVDVNDKGVHIRTPMQPDMLKHLDAVAEKLRINTPELKEMFYSHAWQFGQALMVQYSQTPTSRMHSRDIRQLLYKKVEITMRNERIALPQEVELEPYEQWIGGNAVKPKLYKPRRSNMPQEEVGDAAPEVEIEEETSAPQNGCAFGHYFRDVRSRMLEEATQPPKLKKPLHRMIEQSILVGFEGRADEVERARITPYSTTMLKQLPEMFDYLCAFNKKMPITKNGTRTSLFEAGEQARFWCLAEGYAKEMQAYPFDRTIPSREAAIAQALDETIPDAMHALVDNAPPSDLRSMQLVAAAYGNETLQTIIKERCESMSSTMDEHTSHAERFVARMAQNQGAIERG